jgi:hypothetical protein
MKPSFAVVGAVTLLTVCALTAAGPTARAATDGQTVAPAGTRLLPTVHPPVPSDLNALWYAPSRTAPLTPPLANFVKGVRLLEEENKADAALPLLRQPALSTTAPCASAVWPSPIQTAPAASDAQTRFNLPSVDGSGDLFMFMRTLLGDLRSRAAIRPPRD